MNRTNRLSRLAALVSGVTLGALIVVACSDDSPGPADAATCECPAAEPPLAGRITRVRVTGDISPNNGGNAGAACPTGATLLGGSCRLMVGNRGILLAEAGNVNGDGQGYQCVWQSTTVQPDTGISEAICLIPAP